MTDRELLELASKAAGLKHVDYSNVDYDGRLGIMLVDEFGRHTISWSPLTDDGDALRLAVKLNIEIAINPGTQSSRVYIHRYGVDSFGITNLHKGDAVAATRRAIVHAAAEIGKAMP